MKPPHIRVRKHEDHQHYKSRRTPPWIKWHRDCLTSYRFTNLPDAAKWHAVGVALLASQMDNHVPADPDWLARQLSTTEPVDLEHLLDARFVEWCDCDECPSPPPSPEKKRADKSRADEKRAGARARAREASKTLAPSASKVLAREFDRFWEAYPVKKGKQAALAKYTALRGNGKMPDIDALLEKIALLKRDDRDWQEGYAKHPTTWLNQGCWDDEIKPLRGRQPPDPKLDRFRDREGG